MVATTRTEVAGDQRRRPSLISQIGQPRNGFEHEQCEARSARLIGSCIRQLAPRCACACERRGGQAGGRHEGADVAETRAN